MQSASQTRRTRDLRPKGLTPEEVERAKKDAGSFWPGQIVLVNVGKKKPVRAKVIAVDEETDELRLRLLGSEEPAIAYPAQADAAFDHMSAPRKKH